MNTFKNKIGKSIRIYLAEGEVTGIRHAEVVNWTGQAIHCPRIKATELSKWDEVSKPGVYFLFGYDDKNAFKQKVYIGEAENVYTRLQKHLTNKDFWDEVILFSNKDKNLTKSHIKYLESRINQIATKVNRYNIENRVVPKIPTLPRGDVSSMEEFILNIRLLLGVLGHKLLEALSTTQTNGNKQSLNNPSKYKKEISFKTKEVDAKGLYTDEGVIVLNGSSAKFRELNSFSSSYKSLRQQLIKDDVVKLDNNHIEFKKNYLFESPTPAASILAGYSINGRTCWKTSEGLTIKELDKK